MVRVRISISDETKYTVAKFTAYPVTQSGTQGNFQCYRCGGRGSGTSQADVQQTEVLGRVNLFKRGNES